MRGEGASAPLCVAPLSFRKAAACSRPFCTASSSGVFPHLSRGDSFAPSSSLRQRTAARLPSHAATCSGVRLS